MRARQDGLTLVELMVAMLIGLVITGAVLQVFLSNKTTFLLQDSMSRLQENGRFALQHLSSEIRPAGNSVGIRFPDDQICVATNAGQNLGAQAAQTIFGFRATNQTIGGRAVLPGTDVISVTQTDSCDAWVSGNWQPTNSNISASSFCPSMGQGRAMMVFDLTQAVVFSITNNVNAGATNPTLTHSASNNGTDMCGGHRFDGITFDNSARIVSFGNRSFFVANTDRVDPQGRPIPALWVHNNLAPAGERGPFEIVDGVASLRAEYGLSTAAGSAVEGYVATNAMATADWANVRSVRLNLLLMSDQNTPGADAQTIEFDGANVAADGRLRQIYSTVVALRNRVD